MPNDNFGPWTTSLTTGSRLELSAFWKGRLSRLAAVADGRFDSRRKGRWGLLTIALVTALVPMLRAQNEPVVAFEPKSAAPEGPLPDDSNSSASLDVPIAADEVALLEAPPTQPASRETFSDDPQARELQKALRDAVAYLSGLQRDDGSWNQQDQANVYQTGITSLGALALVQAGVKPNDLRLRRAADYVREQKPELTYEVALQTLALCALEPKRDADLIQRNVQRLEGGQRKEGPNRGGWSYGSGSGIPQGGGDNSNSDFAIWGLDAAAKAGANVRRETWESALKYWVDRQSVDGGWSYSGPVGGKSTGSMTTAGVASVAICLAHLTNDERKPTGEEQAALDRGLKWMNTNFAVSHNPGAGAGQWLLYYAVMFRRAADATKTERLGDHDWRYEFAEYFLSQRNRVNGTWLSPGIEGNPVPATSLVLLALVGADPAFPSKKGTAK